MLQWLLVDILESLVQQQQFLCVDQITLAPRLRRGVVVRLRRHWLLRLSLVLETDIVSCSLELLDGG
jgi:hypothetical protein